MALWISTELVEASCFSRYAVLFSDSSIAAFLSVVFTCLTKLFAHFAARAGSFHSMATVTRPVFLSTLTARMSLSNISKASQSVGTSSWSFHFLFSVSHCLGKRMGFRFSFSINATDNDRDLSAARSEERRVGKEC